MNALGASIAVVGAAIGIGLAAYAALTGMARQPEIAGKLQTAMIIAGALIEGVALFAIVVALLK